MTILQNPPFTELNTYAFPTFTSPKGIISLLESIYLYKIQAVTRFYLETNVIALEYFGYCPSS